MFLEAVNHRTGERGWKVSDENYDLAQEIARSGFADMIHDLDRNQKYELGIKSVIDEVHSKGKEAHVIDIGTGTGLLSLIAARNGADRITAIEVFQPMADIARKIFSKYDIPNKGNIIVAEVFDTELIGEGALRTFKEALQHLAQPGTRVVPSSARIWAVPVESEQLYKFHQSPSFSLYSPISDCDGAAAVFDLQLSEFPVSHLNFACEPFIALSFNFEDINSIKYHESIATNFKVSGSSVSQLHAVLMWWDLDMDGTGKYIISLAPKWMNKEACWRDHWMQAVYFFPKPVPVKRNQEITLRCTHDEFSLWFRIDEGNYISSEDAPPCCKCGLHVTCSRNAIYRLNDLDTSSVFTEFLKRNCAGKRVICVNEGSLMGLMAAKFALSVIIIDSNPHFRSVLEAYTEKNKLDNVRIFAEEEDVQDERIDLVLSEPFFLSAILPWNNLRYWFAVQSLISKYPNIEFLPKSGTLYALPVSFEELWKIVAPVGNVSGFDLSAFDKINQAAREAADAIVEPHPLWEYPSLCTGDKQKIAEFNMAEAIPIENDVSEKTISLIEGTNAIAFWMDWQMDKEYTMTTGLILPCSPGEKPQWSKSYKQGVYFFPESQRNSSCSKLSCRTSFSPSSGDISFNFVF
ncbi:hypothetical protein AB6A40_007081 [Gnathostoma spinigerum]|uniref:Protein arginine N-methyltransferase n=1 Tax=Gnathostoma spinigerum TaxID=75299 RepID=A0ABD6EUL1_9BILA